MRTLFINSFFLLTYIIITSCTGGENKTINNEDSKNVELESVKTSIKQNAVKLPARIQGASPKKSSNLQIDDTEKLQTLLNNGGVVNLGNDKVYKVNSPLFVLKDDTKIIGNNALIQFSYRQSKDSPSYSESLFIVKNKNGVTFSNIRLQYLGSYDLGTYDGMISGVYVTGASNFVADSVEAFGFNRAGLNLGTGTNDYNDKPIVKNCYLHDNRVAGCVYGNNDFGVVKNNRFHHNGLKGDSETGYGFAGWSASLPKNTSVTNNQANYNIRKGIDFHSGSDGEIIGNRCKGNLLVGIYANGVVGKWTIKGNTISDMQNSSSSKSISGIEFGNRDRNKNPKQSIVFIISKNKILNFTNNPDGLAFPILIYSSSIGQSGITVSDNVFNCGNITSFIMVNASGKRKSSDFYDISISNNDFKATQTFLNPIYLKGSQNRRKSIVNNSISIERAVGNAKYVIINDQSLVGNNSLTVEGNTINVPTKGYTIKGSPIFLRDPSKEKISSNKLVTEK